MVKHYICTICNRKANRRDRRPVPANIQKYLKKNLSITCTIDSVVCSGCRIKFYRKLRKPKESGPVPIDERGDAGDALVPPSTNERFTSPPSVMLKISSISRSHSRCFVCKRPGPKLVCLPAEGRFTVFLDHNILVPADARCCPVHISDGTLTQDSFSNIQTLTSTSLLNRSSICNILQKMRNACLNQNTSLNFDALDERDYPSLTGLTKPQFDDFCSHLLQHIKTTPKRSPRTTVGLFLVKLYSGMSNKLLSTIFGLSKSSVRRAIETVRLISMRTVVPIYLGIETVPRSTLIQNHTRQLAKTLFNADDNQLILVLDGTYIYINKSNNFKFQRRSFSMHKGRPLVKPMVVVTTTGHFVTIVGPYLADGKNNDAAILNHMLRANIQNFREFLQEGDILVVDRGFRDSLTLLADLGINAEMPALISKGQKQLSTKEANSSRLVTKVRWVVESANARIKRFKMLATVLPCSQVPFIGDFVRIVCAICNKYLPALSSPSQTEADSQVAQQMLLLAERANTLQEYVQEWSRTEVKNDTSLLTVRLQSRHTSSRRYLMWIRSSDTAVEAWYCQCRAGARVVGMCAHVSAIVWYLAFARHQESTRYGVRDWGSHLEDAATFQIDSSSDSD
ncbi:uncharacterized protein LOC132716364, partial [Ruditapes philippinarum]|uniref:uncharacterized protein LOC132716364 n=1 Tax=Ruditapes philippinarum TaxID=129788 RepID=UPI00295A8DED